MKKRSFIFLLAVSLFWTQSFSAGLGKTSVSLNPDSIVITGSLPDALPYANVTLLMLREGWAFESLTPQNLKQAALSLQQVNLNADKTYSFTIDMTGCAVGEYPVRLSADGADVLYEDNIFYATPEHKKAFVEQACLAGSAKELEQLLYMKDENNTTARLFGLRDPLYFSTDTEKTAELLFQNLKDEPLSEMDSDAFIKRLYVCSVIQSLNQGTTFDITAYAEILELDSSFLNTYTAKITAPQKKVFTAQFKNKGLQKKKEAQKAFGETVFLTVVNHIQNWADIDYVIKTHGDQVGIDAAEYRKFSKKEELAVRLAKRAPYTEMQLFLTAYTEEKADLIKPVPSTTPRPPSGGGIDGGGVNVDNSQTLPPIPSETFAPQETQKPKEKPFSDLDSVPWAEEAIVYLFENNMISGTQPNIFEPNREILREELVKMLVGACSLRIDGKQATFTDVSKEDWFYPYVAAAQDAGLIQGYADGSFGAGNRITREELMTLAYRAAKLEGLALDETPQICFSDDDSISNFAKASVYAMANAGIASGVGDNRFAPQEFCTRAQAAKVLYGLLQLGGGNL